MPNVNDIIISSSGAQELTDIKTITFHAKSNVTGRICEILEIKGTEDDLESFINRIKKQIDKIR